MLPASLALRQNASMNPHGIGIRSMKAGGARTFLSAATPEIRRPRFAGDLARYTLLRTGMSALRPASTEGLHGFGSLHSAGMDKALGSYETHVDSSDQDRNRKSHATNSD